MTCTFKHIIFILYGDQLNVDAVLTYLKIFLLTSMVFVINEIATNVCTIRYTCLAIRV